MGARVEVRCGRCHVPILAYRQCPEKIDGKPCALDLGYCRACGGDELAMAAMAAHIAVHRPLRAAWSGPRVDDLDSSSQDRLRAPVPPERWPYGPPEFHQDACKLWRAGVYCDCAASDASDTGHGAGA